MNVSRQARVGRLWLSLPLALVLLALAWGIPGAARADDTGTRLTLNARGDGVTCDEPSEPTECAVPLAGPFTLAVELFDVPAEGYVALTTQIDFHGLTWVPAATADENTWPDNGLPLRSPEAPGVRTQVVSHGGLTGTALPLPVSTYEGSVVEITLTCVEETASVEIALVNLDLALSPLGASITLPNPPPEGTIMPSKAVGERSLDLAEDGIITTVPVADVLTINCQVVPPTPTPTSTPQQPAQPTATAGATGLPPTGYGGDATGDARLPLLIVGVLVSAAGVLGLSGWRLARSRPN